MIKLLYKLFSYYVITSLTEVFCCINKLSDTGSRSDFKASRRFLMIFPDARRRKRSVAGLREYFGNAVAGKKGKNRAVRRKSDRLLSVFYSVRPKTFTKILNKSWAFVFFSLT